MRSVLKCLLLVLLLTFSRAYLALAEELHLDRYVELLDENEKALALKNPKVDVRLLRLSKETDSVKRQQMAQAEKLDVVDSNVRVVIELNKEGEDLAFLENYGASIECVYGRFVQAMVPIDRLAAFDADDRVACIRPPQKFYPAESTTGAITTEALARIGAESYHQAGIKGRGVKVAIIDIAFNSYLNNPELPAQNIAEVKSFRADGKVEDPSDPGGVHGTACAELVLDIAPDASLYLYAISTDVEFASAVDWAIERGVNIISMSGGWLAAPHDGTGFLCDVVNRARNAGVLFLVAAGNCAQGHYEGTFADSDGDKWHNFSGNDEVLDLGYLNAGTPIDLVLTWNDWPRATQDYDMYLLYMDMAGDVYIVGRSINVQNGYQQPVEEIFYVANYSGYYGVAVRKYSATRNVRLELFSYYPDLAEYRVPEGSLSSPADAAGALAVGAVSWVDDSLRRITARVGPPMTDAQSRT